MNAVILIGVQGAGKSTFYQQHFAATHLRVNLDTLRTRRREDQFLQACLATQQPFVVDNTNPTNADRARYILPARAAGFRISGYYFDLSVAECLARNAEREGKARVPPQAIYATARRLELPTRAEGFDALYRVRSQPGGAFLIEEWYDEVR